MGSERFYTVAESLGRGVSAALAFATGAISLLFMSLVSGVVCAIAASVLLARLLTRASPALGELTGAAGVSCDSAAISPRAAAALPASSSGATAFCAAAFFLAAVWVLRAGALWFLAVLRSPVVLSLPDLTSALGAFFAAALSRFLVSGCCGSIFWGAIFFCLGFLRFGRLLGRFAGFLCLCRFFCFSRLGCFGFCSFFRRRIE